MSRHKLEQAGFTIAELTVVIVLVGMLSIIAFAFADNAINQYFSLQQDASDFSDLATHYQRLANVLRGLTDITEASSNDITIYAYFAPSDAYVSYVHYYVSGGQLLADVTPMSANPPSGTQLTAQKKTYTIVNNFFAVSGVNTFVYLDANGNVLNTPISDLHTVKGIQLNLAVPSSLPSPHNQALTLQVSLRNRKTNL